MQSRALGMPPVVPATVSLAFLLMAATLVVAAPQVRAVERPVHTFSIVAIDPETGQLGVAVQSHWFSVGSIVTWGEAGVGVIATQSFVEPAYGQRGLDLMRSGLDARQTLEALLSVDPGREVRQVAMVDAAGTVAVHTGSRCIQSAGHQAGDGYSVQANMMVDDSVVPAMAAGFEAAEGPLAYRLLAALEAGQAAGGDIRGRQSAALLVVAPSSTGRPWIDRIVDLRIEDHAQPIVELRRLLDLHTAYGHMNAGDLAIERGELETALVEYGTAARLAPNNLEMVYWHAVTLATNDRIDDAVPLFRRVFTADPGWIELTRRLCPAGIVPDTPDGLALVERVLEEAAP